MENTKNKLYDSKWKNKYDKLVAEKKEYETALDEIFVALDDDLTNIDEKSFNKIKLYRAKIEKIKEKEVTCFLGQFKTIEALMVFIQVSVKQYISEFGYPTKDIYFTPKNNSDALIIWNEYIEYLSQFRQFSYKKFLKS